MACMSTYVPTYFHGNMHAYLVHVCYTHTCIIPIYTHAYFVHIHPCMSAYIKTYLHVYNIYVCINTYMHCMHMYIMLTHRYSYMTIYMYIYIYKHICMLTLVNIWLHTYINTSRLMDVCAGTNTCVNTSTHTDRHAYMPNTYTDRYSCLWMCILTYITHICQPRNT